ALITPPLTVLFLRKLEWRQTLGLMAFFCLTPAVLAALFSQALVQPELSPTPPAAVLASPAVWLAGLVFLLYAPLEGSISVWATTYLTDAGHSERRASLMLSGFWAAF